MSDQVTSTPLCWTVVSLNVGLPGQCQFGDTRLVTGIRKHAVEGPLKLTMTGLEGDGVANTKYHGGPDKAVCVYSASHYPFWEQLFGHPLPPAAFGENLTVSALDEEQLCVGDILKLGDARVQVTQPRQPCRTLAMRHGCEDLVERIIHNGRCGLYLRVLNEGVVQPADSLVLTEQDPHRVSVARAHRVRHLAEDGREGLEQVLAVPALSASWRETLTRRRAT